MADQTSIEWLKSDGLAGATWNPVAAYAIPPEGTKERRGWFCIHVNGDCKFCYAEDINVRLGTGWEYIAQNLDKHRFEIIRDPRSQSSIDWPLRTKRPRKIFPFSMTDLFASWHTDEMIDEVFAVMGLAKQHTFIVTTKQSERMLEYMSRGPRDTASGKAGWLDAINRAAMRVANRPLFPSQSLGMVPGPGWPLPNLWLGVSAGTQPHVDEHVPRLLECEAVVHWISIEPYLSQLTLVKYLYTRYLHGGPYHERNRLDWVVGGYESGSEARAGHPDWIRQTRNECVAAGVPFHFKQWGSMVDVDRAIKEFGFNPYGKHSEYHYAPGSSLPFIRMDKNKTGRTLDGRTWDECPVIPPHALSQLFT